MKTHLGKWIGNGWMIFCGHKVTKANNHVNMNNIADLKSFRELPEEERCSYCNRIAKHTKLIT